MFYCILALILTTPIVGTISGTSPQEKIVEEFVFEKAPFRECHAPTIEATPEGVVVAWFAGSKEGNEDTGIWLSRRTSNGWTPPQAVANGNGEEAGRFPSWNPVLYQIPGGDLLLFYKVGPDPSSWWGFVKRSSDHGKSWSAPEHLPDGFMGPIKNRPFLTDEGSLICPSSTEASPDEGWTIHFETTPDFGKTWSITLPAEDPQGLNAIQPSILHHPDGTLQALARSKDGGVVQSFSTDHGEHWSAISPTGLPNPNSGIDAITLQEGIHLLVYNHVSKPAEEWGGPRTPLNVALSKEGVEWRMVRVLESEEGEFSYPAGVQDSAGVIHIVYTWKRSHIKHVSFSLSDILPEDL